MQENSFKLRKIYKFRKTTMIMKLKFLKYLAVVYTSNEICIL